MTRITLNQATAALLHDLGDPVELCDESGRVLGTFLPAGRRPKHEDVEEGDPRRREEEARLGPSMGPLAFMKDLE